MWESSSFRLGVEPSLCVSRQLKDSENTLFRIPQSLQMDGLAHDKHLCQSAVPGRNHTSGDQLYSGMDLECRVWIGRCTSCWREIVAIPPTVRYSPGEGGECQYWMLMSLCSSPIVNGLLMDVLVISIMHLKEDEMSWKRASESGDEEHETVDQ